jgi:hypothetical protein
MKPTTTAETENNRKNAEPRKPNCFRRQAQLLHDRHAGEPDHHLVGEIDQHEQEQQCRNSPGATRRRLHFHDGYPPSAGDLVANTGLQDLHCFSPSRQLEYDPTPTLPFGPRSKYIRGSMRLVRRAGGPSLNCNRATRMTAFFAST